MHIIISYHCYTVQKLQTNNKFGPPDLTDYEYADNDHRINRYHQAIIPSYKFDGCGNITAWGVDVFYDDQNSYTLDFQVWRPSPTVDSSTGTGCYSLVGNNRFTSISLINDLAIVTPSPQDYVQYQPGDVLGFYIENAAQDHNGIVLRTSPSWLTSELVWFASITGTAKTSLNGDCPYSVGSGGVLGRSTRAAPVISIATSKCISLKHFKIILNFSCSSILFLLFFKGQYLTYSGYTTTYFNYGCYNACTCTADSLRDTHFSKPRDGIKNICM